MTERITTPYPFLALQDLSGTIEPLAPIMSSDQAGRFEQDLFMIEQRFAPKDSTFYKVDARQLTMDVEHLVDDYLTRHKDKQIGVLCLDRDIFENKEGGDFYRLQLSRSPNQTLVSRRNCSLTPDQQFDRLKEWVQCGAFDELVVVDDVLAFGETAEKIVTTIRGVAPNVSMQYIVGIASEGGTWRGVEKARELTGGEPIAAYIVTASEQVEDGSKGMAIPTSRDLTLLGGKSAKDERGEQRCYPYFLPFSKPLASIIRTDSFTEASRELLRYNRELFLELGSIAGRDITLADLACHAAGTPDTSLDEYRDKITPLAKDKSMRVVDFIDGSLDIIAE